ncbi:hypothetical protein BDK92_5794 [Micromonospora pisi]|uniref:Glyoxalase/bleomycin resistance protein/dioxygenase superfamily protein n=1 Tax=Micromonospora pisi TaxID=589240 RepID=A0A495JTH6_9ACTN|nr:hypothetical protein [Micromonospora pisi]RKR91399.1 hypothetical protein BDK92_5794 [Micromonospora pisi]
MTSQRMDNVLIVVDDLDAVISFFVELGMKLEGKGPIEGRWVERVIIGIDDVRQDDAMLPIVESKGFVYSYCCPNRNNCTRTRLPQVNNLKVGSSGSGR